MSPYRQHADTRAPDVLVCSGLDPSGGAGFIADVRVIEYGRPGGTAVAEADTAVAEPLVLHLEDEPLSQGYIEIIDAGMWKPRFDQGVGPLERRPGLARTAETLEGHRGIERGGRLSNRKVIRQLDAALFQPRQRTSEIAGAVIRHAARH